MKLLMQSEELLTEMVCTAGQQPRISGLTGGEQGSLKEDSHRSASSPIGHLGTRQG